MFLERFDPNHTLSNYRRAVRDDRWKLIRRERAGPDSEWFYDLTAPTDGSDGPLQTRSGPHYDALRDALDAWEAKP